MLKLNGAGWIKEDICGSLVKGLERRFSGLKELHADLLADSVLLKPIENFSRFDILSKKACLSVALALKDAGVAYPVLNAGLIGTNACGALQAQEEYFKDYVDNGRKTARGNLFIYTLPSSPLAEAAIHFGLRGPLLYVNFDPPDLKSLFDYASSLIVSKEADSMLAVKADEERAIAFLLSREKLNPSAKVIPIGEALTKIEELGL
jgi:hypothetical protein